MKGDPKIILFRCPLKFNMINKPIFRYTSKEGTETCFRIIWEQKQTSGTIFNTLRVSDTSAETQKVHMIF